MAVRQHATFISPMLLLRTDRLPDDPKRFAYQLKLDGYRAVAFKRDARLYLRSRNNKDFSLRYPDVLKGLATLPNDTVIDGEIVALDDEGRPSFNILQNAGSSPAHVQYYVFDLLMLAGTNVMHESL